MGQRVSLGLKGFDSEVEMVQTTKKALALLREVKSVAFATVNNEWPDARIADVMLVEEDGVYLITARGKPYYQQLMSDKKLAICGMDQNYVAVRVVGDVQLCDDRVWVDKIFEHNPMMNDLYPGKKRDILEAFHLYRGKGEIFDLSIEPPVRERFAFGGETVNPPGYRITEKCAACGDCIAACPVDVITAGDIYHIDGTRCLECGRCAEMCPEDAIEAAPGM
jgi:uncharacterized pyridoxamine 5'-phosphate oxidase family protein/Pyruvate/2-oxoacid:ferredoxin oxidoreductase delta subunit